MLPYFPDPNVAVKHQPRDYILAGFTFICVTISLSYDGSAPLEHQKTLAVLAWVFLITMLWGEDKHIRVQVMIAVVFATIGENFAALYMEGYSYRFNNIPLYIPAGHGMVYLTAVAMARSGFFQRYAREISIFVVFIGAFWALWGMSDFASRKDDIGAILFCIFLACLFKGRSPMVYLAAFFITSWLEIVGTSSGTWVWAEIDPATGLAQGNPPSGVAAWYCLVDAVAMAGANPVLAAYTRFCNWLRFKFKGEVAYQGE
ncbi:MAG: hypothetical protein GQ569_13625 [Methylococcaceae bacterium]|nr:hypothetical protein [Methylococcaceae bacterium]